MAQNIVTYALEFSQAQLKAFLEFISLGDKLSSLIFHHNSFTYSIVDIMRWDQACLALFYIRTTGALFNCLPSYSLQLDREHVDGLRDMLEVANKLQIAFLRLPQRLRVKQNEELYLQFTAAQGVFYEEVRRVVATTKCG